MYRLDTEPFATGIPIPRVGSALACLVAVLTLAGCSSDSPSDSGFGLVTYTTVVQRSHTGFETAGHDVIRDRQTWEAVWQQINAGGSPTPATPSVDFSRDMLVLTAMGEQTNGCYYTDITAITAGGGSLAVAVVENEPGADCICTAAITHPVHVVQLARRDATPAFDVSRRVMSCG